MAKVNRYDRIDAPNWMTQTFSRNAEGFLVGRANVTNIGVFTYKDEAGNERKELRLPEEVFSSDSLMSMKLKPLTNDHPNEMITSANIDKYQVGTMGSNPSTPSAYSDGEPDPWDADRGVWDYPNGRLPDSDRIHLTCDMVISDEEAIKDVLEGKMELSAGYTAEIEESSGTWLGVKYDAIQRNIRYNHVAIVDKARAGDSARIILRQDSAGAVCDGHFEVPKKEENKMDKKIRIDGVEYSVPEHVAVKLESVTSRVDEAEKKAVEFEATATGLQAKLDNAESKVEELNKELKEAKDSAISPERIQAEVKARKLVEDASEKAGIEIKADMSNTDIKKAVVMSVYGKKDESDKDLEKKLDSEVYLDGRFDGALETLKTRKDSATGNVQIDIPTEDSFKNDGVTEEEIEKYDSEIENAWERK